MYKFSPQIKEEFNSKKINFFVNLSPYFKGCWLLYCPFLSLFPKEERMVKIEVGVAKRKLFDVELDISDPPQFSMVKRKWYDLGTAFLIWSLLGKGDTFIDVGANNGYFSSIAAQKVGESGMILALEPNKSAYQKLLERKLINVLPLNYAALDVCGQTLKLKRPFYRQTTSSYCLPAKGDIISITLNYLYEKFNKPNIKLIKIDTEGAELLIIKGAKKILSEKSPYVILEISGYSKRFSSEPIDVYKEMKEMGYDNYYYILNDNNLSLEPLEEKDFSKGGQVLFSKKKVEAYNFQL